MLNVIQELGYDYKEWNWVEVFDHIAKPCLFHASNDVRMVAIEVIAGLY